MDGTESTGRCLGKCPHCGAEVYERRYIKGTIACEPPSPQCGGCGREVSPEEVKK